MADGKTHERYARLGWYIIIPLGILLFVFLEIKTDHFYWWYDLQYWLFLYLNFLLVEISSPDLDHSARNRDESDALNFFRGVNLGFIIPDKLAKKYFLFLIIKRILRRFGLGIIGALYVAWAQIYEFICLEAADLVGKNTSHRVWLSHKLLFSAIGRMIWFNVPFAMLYWFMVNYSIANWGSPPFSEIGFRYFWGNIWIIPYLITQFISWFIGDVFHILLDTEWSKGKLYGFQKYGDKRSPLLKKIINKDWADGKKRKRKRK